MKKKIYIIINYFLPGENAGGPVNSINNLTNLLGKDNSLNIITLNHDMNETISYKNIPTNVWIKRSDYSIMYLKDEDYNVRRMSDLIDDNENNIIYLQSYFNKITINFMISRKRGLFKNNKFIIAPRGEFSEGALKLKKQKKYAFMKFARNIYKGVVFQATNEKEKVEIQKIYPNAEVYIASNIPVKYVPFKKEIKKNEFELKCIFLSRISRMKNLKFILKVIENIPKFKGSLVFDIYGPLEDEGYFNECKEIMERLNKREEVKITYKGKIKSEEVIEKIKRYHVFLFPTLGENFGHVILESLSAHTPLIMSDTTYFNKLEKYNIGYNIPLNCPKIYQSRIEEFIKMDQDEYDSKLTNFEYYINESIDRDEIRNQYLRIFK